MITLVGATFVQLRNLNLRSNRLVRSKLYNECVWLNSDKTGRSLRSRVKFGLIRMLKVNRFTNLGIGVKSEFILAVS